MVFLEELSTVIIRNINFPDSATLCYLQEVVLKYFELYPFFFQFSYLRLFFLIR